MNSSPIEAFLTDLAVSEQVAPSTQNQALAVLLFLYQQVLRQELDAPIDAGRAKKSQRLPVVLGQAEGTGLVGHLSEPCQLLAKLMYGCGLRLMETIFRTLLFASRLYSLAKDGLKHPKL